MGVKALHTGALEQWGHRPLPTITDHTALKWLSSG